MLMSVEFIQKFLFNSTKLWQIFARLFQNNCQLQLPLSFTRTIIIRRIVIKQPQNPAFSCILYELTVQTPSKPATVGVASVKSSDRSSSKGVETTVAK